MQAFLLQSVTFAVSKSQMSCTWGYWLGQAQAQVETKFDVMIEWQYLSAQHPDVMRMQQLQPIP